MSNKLPENYLISIIVPIFNVESYLDKCVKSILRQTYKNIEIILIDDGSDDRSGSIIDKYSKIDRRIIAIHQQNNGISSARNKGLSICKGDYVGFVDGDDYIEETMYEKMLNSCIKAGSDISICGRYINQRMTNKIGLCPKENTCIEPTKLLDKIFKWDGVDFAVWDKLYKKELWNNITFPIGKINEDIFVLYKVIINAKKISLIDEPLYYWVMRYDSTTHTINGDNIFHFEEAANSIIKYVEIHCPSILYSAELYHKSSILYTIMYITRVTKQQYKKYYNRFYSYKTILKQYHKKYRFNKKESFIYYRYKYHLLRISYYKHQLFRKNSISNNNHSQPN